MFQIKLFNKEENVLISRTRGESAVADSAELNRKAILQRAAYFSRCANISVDGGISSGTKD
jgi:hypothetical protein